MTWEIPTSARVGDVCVVSLTDAFGTFASFEHAFPRASAPVARLARELHPELFAGAAWVLPFRAFLILHPEANVLVDAGVGPPPGRFLPERQGWLPSALESTGIGKEGVDAVLLTHSHVDHVGWTVDEAGEPVFAHADYLLPTAEWCFLQSGGGEGDVVASRVFPLERLGVLRLVAAGTEVLPGVTAVATPGHTPGHVSVLVRSRREVAWIIGDACVHPAQLIDPELAYVHDVDAAVAAATRRDLLARLRDDGALVCAGHFPGSGFGRIHQAADGYRWRER